MTPMYYCSVCGKHYAIDIKPTTNKGFAICCGKRMRLVYNANVVKSTKSKEIKK